MRSVTLSEFQSWLKKPEVVKHLWLSGKFIGELAEDFQDVTDLDIEKKTMKAKYFDIQIDTRDMNVWGISVRGMGDDFFVRDTNEKDDKTILDEVLRILDNDKE